MKNADATAYKLQEDQPFDHEKEYKYVTSYLEAVNNLIGRENIKGDILYILLHLKDFGIIDEYFTLGADKDCLQSGALG